MPDLLNRSLEDMLADMAGQFGVRWPNPWWPTGNSAYDDCAAAVSYFLFGLNSYRNPFYSYVSQLQNFFAAQGRRTWGHQGIQRGDVLAFSWTQDPNSFDHTEIALGPVSPAGLITSRGTNSNPGDDMRDRTRSAAYVVSYSRPAYPGTTTASVASDVKLIDGSEAAQPEEDYSMTDGAFFRLKDGEPAIGSIGAGSIFYQEKPRSPLVPLQDEWWGYAANGNKAADMTNQQLSGIINTCGVFKTGAQNRLLPAKPGEASFDGHAIYLP